MPTSVDEHAARGPSPGAANHRPPSPPTHASAALWLDKTWALLSSPRLALVVILLIVAASLVGVLLMQAPASAKADPLSYARWLAQIQPKYGPATTAFNALGLFNVFGSWWFRLLVTLLAANILMCALNRGGVLLRGAFAIPRITMPESFFSRAKLQAAVTVDGLSQAEAESLLKRGLGRSGYRVSLEREEGAVHAFGDRHRFAPLGTLLHHLSLVALLLGFVVSGAWGNFDDSFIMAEGTARPIGDTGLTVYLDSFVDEYYPEGPPKDYRSEVTLYEGGQVVKQAVVRVNSPLVYSGVRLHQSFFGQAVVMEVRDSNGSLVAAQAVPLAYRAKERPVGSFIIPQGNLEAYVIAPASSFLDANIPPGQVRLEVYRPGDNQPFVMGNVTQGQSTTLAGLTYTFVRERQFSGFRVVQDPGRPILWAGAIGIALGLIWVLYFPHRQVWARAQRQSDGTWVLRIGAAAGAGGQFSHEFAKIAERLSKAAAKASTQRRAVPTEVR